MTNHKLDTDSEVYFYEQDFYVLSNFSAFKISWSGRTFDTSEQLYHWLRFSPSTAEGQICREQIEKARSAHDAFRFAQENKKHQRRDWDEVKVAIMRDILLAKAQQHEYVRRKLLASGDRELIEDSWRDAFWGWGADHMGENMLGKLWMQVRAELRTAKAAE